MLGGTPAFISQYYEACGGEENARAWLYHYDIRQRSETRPEKFDGKPGRWMKELYDLAEWPYPVYPNNRCGTILTGDDIDWSPMFGDRIKSAGPRVE